MFKVLRKVVSRSNALDIFLSLLFFLFFRLLPSVFSSHLPETTNVLYFDGDSPVFHCYKRHNTTVIATALLGSYTQFKR